MAPAKFHLPTKKPFLGDFSIGGEAGIYDSLRSHALGGHLLHARSPSRTHQFSSCPPQPTKKPACQREFLVDAERQGFEPWISCDMAV